MATMETTQSETYRGHLLSVFVDWDYPQTRVTTIDEVPVQVLITETSTTYRAILSALRAVVDNDFRRRQI